MNKFNKLRKHGSSALVSTAGVCLLLSSPTLANAEGLKPNELKVQDDQVNKELKNENENKVDNNDSKKEELKDNNSNQENTKEVKTDDVKKDNLKPDIQKDKPQVEDQKTDTQKENNNEHDNLKVNEEVQPRVANVQPATVGTDVVQLQENQIIEYSNGNGIWSKPYGLDGAYYIGDANRFAGKEVRLTQKMTVNNVVWYHFNVNGQEGGWVDGKVLSKLTNFQELKEDTIMGATRDNGIWTVPYGVNGAEYKGSSDNYAYTNIKLLMKANFGSTTWYKFSSNGKVVGWVDGKALDKGNIKPANFKVTLGDATWHSMWSKPYGVANCEFLGSTHDYAYQTVQVMNTVKVENTNWYQVKTNNGIVGWIDGEKATTDMEILPVENSVAMVSTSINSSDGVWTVPYGEPGANWLSSVSDYSFKQVTIIQRAKKNGVIWSKIKLGDRVLGWVDSRTLSDSIIHAENKTVMIGDTNGHDIWTLPYGQNNAKYVAPVSTYMNKPIRVTGSVAIGQTTWYLINVDGRELGWVDFKAISNATDIRTMNKVYHVSNAQSHGVLTRPWGMQNASWIGSAVDYKNMNLNVEMSLNYNGVTWYGFKNQKNQMSWVDSRAMDEGNVLPRLNVPIIEQRDRFNPSRDLIYGCEITAVTMMLQYAGANVDKVQMANEMPYHPFDPNKGFVGSPWGGVGHVNTIYPSALTGLVNKYTGNSMDLTGGDVWSIKNRLDKNHPVVVWMGGMHGFGIHAITLTGYDNDRVYYNDPWTGEKEASMYWSDFNGKWGSKNRKAISY